MTEPLSRRAQAPGVPLGWALGFGALTPFFQADGSSTRAHDGAGLGLTVAARLCTRISGSLTLRSTPGQGTTVTIRVPAHAR